MINTEENECVTSNLPEVSKRGLDILKIGGNATDAAIAMFVATSVIQPMLCGIGGDINCMFYRSADHSVFAVNGTGRTGKAFTMENIKSLKITGLNTDTSMKHGIFITVPGAVAGLFKCLKHFGSKKLTMEQILDPVISLAEKGFVTSVETSNLWKQNYPKMASCHNREDLISSNEIPPLEGSHVTSPKVANILKILGSKGPEEFYGGVIGEKIVDCVQNAGGMLTLEDMTTHLRCSTESDLEQPTYIDFQGFRIWEMNPNTIGMVVLVALNILEGFDLQAIGHNSADYIHILVETIAIAFEECWNFLCDSSSSFKHLLTKEFAKEKRKSIDLNRHRESSFQDRHSTLSGNTAYVAAVDKDGNACSLMGSVSSFFGSTHIPDQCGFILHDRGKFFSFDESSEHAFGPMKRPVHSVIPAIVTESCSNELLATLGIVGRWMQPQCHIQILLNMIIFGMDPQEAIDQPRFYVGNVIEYMGFKNSLFGIYLEHPTPMLVEALTAKGHCLQSSSRSSTFGNAQIIAKRKLWSKHFTNDDQWYCGNDLQRDRSLLFA